MQNLNYESQTPKYGVNYNAGYIGFLYKDEAMFSKGITYFTEAQDYWNIPVSHVLIVTGENSCVEAVSGRGVIMSDLNKYFCDEHTLTFFKKPKGMDEIIAGEIIQTAERQVGTNYADSLIVNDLMRETFMGQLLDELGNDRIFDAISTTLNKESYFRCSELAAYCLKSADSWSYNNSGILTKPVSTVTPENLFCDREIFEDWKITSLSFG